jgi:hypothetical protein
MRVLVACEFSGTVRRAFRTAGHDAWSCDLLPAEDHDYHHLKMDVLDLLSDGMAGWDLLIAHPPCTHLAVSGARWFKEKLDEQEQALAFVQMLLDVPIPRIALENPVSIISSRIRKPDQIVQPFHFGDPFRKTTCLWLKGLPKLTPTNDLGTGAQACWKEPPHPDRWKRRSRTYPGFAAAMAEQWGAADGPKQQP